MKAQYGLPDKEQPRRHWWYLVFLAGNMLAASWWATQSIAAGYRWHSGLGKPLLGHLYAPWNWWLWQQRIPDTHGIIDQAVTQGQLAFLVPQIAMLMLLFAITSKPKGRDDLHGSAHWATPKDIARSGLLKGKGVVVGGWQKPGDWLQQDTICYLRHDGPEHIMLFAPTRSGKGVSVVLPTLLSWTESSLVLDIKGENWALTSGWRKQQGHTVLRFDPSDPNGASACFNPLEEVRLESLYAIPDVQNIAMMIVDPDGKGLQDHWGKAGFAFIAGVLLHCIIMIRHKEKRPANLYDLGVMLADENRTITELFEEMLETEHEKLVAELFPSGATGGDKLHTFIASSAREMLNKADNEASGVVSTALVNLALYRDPIIAMNTSRCDFHISDLMHRDEPVSLYIILSPDNLDRVRPLTRLIINMIMRRVTDRMEFEDGKMKKTYKYRLLLLLDEFTALGKLEIFQLSLAFMAGYGIKSYIIIQDITQLHGEYGKDEAITANCHIRTAYAPTTPETTKMLSEMTGKTTVVEQKTSLSGSRSGHLKNASVSVTETARNLLTPDEVSRLPGIHEDEQGQIQGGDMLIFAAGFPPIYGRQTLFFQEPAFLSRSKIPAPAQSDRIALSVPEPGLPPLADMLPGMNKNTEEDFYAQVLAHMDDMPADATAVRGVGGAVTGQPHAVHAGRAVPHDD